MGFLSFLCLEFWWDCSSHKSISFRKSMPLLRESVHWLTNQLAERINSFFLSRTIFLVPFGRTDKVREPWASSRNTSLSHMTATDSTWNPSLAASFKHASYTPRTNILTSDTKGTLSHSHSFMPATIINLSLLCCLKEVSLFICVA